MATCIRLVFILLAPVLAGSIPSIALAEASAEHGSGGVNRPDAAGIPYLVLISIDGFRWDYPREHPTPALTRLLSSGAHAVSLRPVYPTLTFPNHYSIATGLYPLEHGIVANRFLDRNRGDWYVYKNPSSAQDGSWYGGEPIWVAVERAGLVSAACFFVGSEASVDGVRPSHWRAFDAGFPGEARVDEALAWLAEPAATRPHLVAMYFEQVDVASHRYGPDSPQSNAAIVEVDGYIGHLLNGLEALPIRDHTYIVVVSDHGQSRYKADAVPLLLDGFLDLAGVDAVDGGTYTLLYLQSPDRARAGRLRDAVNARWRHGTAWLPDEMPAAWHFAAGPRIADVIVQADPGYSVLSSAAKSRTITRGAHGWAPEFRDMHGIFIASGPGIPAGKRIDTMETVDVYPLLLDILGLPDRRPDRREAVLRGLLESPAARE